MTQQLHTFTTIDHPILTMRRRKPLLLINDWVCVLLRPNAGTKDLALALEYFIGKPA
jgi:hypothetical protein